MGYTIIKNGDTPNVQYNQYVCGSYADLSSIKNPIEGSIAYVPENGGVNEYIAIGGKWVNKVIILEEEPEDYVPIHPDWNENDSESPNFINNRTHYVDDENNVHKLPIGFVFDTETNTNILQLNNTPIYNIPSYEIDTDGISEGTLYGGINVIFTLPQTESIEFLYFENPAGFTSPEYMLEFITGSTAPTLELPIEGVSWVEELTLEANKHYQISIMNGIALWCAVDVEVKEEEEGS